jgi:hypothetical protein
MRELTSLELAAVSGGLQMAPPPRPAPGPGNPLLRLIIRIILEALHIRPAPPPVMQA